MSHHDTIHAYYRAFRERDRALLTRILAPDLVHASPFGRHEGRERMLDAIWPHVTGEVWASDLEIYGDGPAYVVRYRHAGTSSARLCEHVRFEGERIAEIEVYLGIGAVPGAS